MGEAESQELRVLVPELSVLVPGYWPPNWNALAGRHFGTLSREKKRMRNIIGAVLIQRGLHQMQIRPKAWIRYTRIRKKGGRRLDYENRVSSTKAVTDYLRTPRTYRETGLGILPGDEDEVLWIRFHDDVTLKSFEKVKPDVRISAQDRSAIQAGGGMFIEAGEWDGL